MNKAKKTTRVFVFNYSKKLKIQIYIENIKKKKIGKRLNFKIVKKKKYKNSN